MATFNNHRVTNHIWDLHYGYPMIIEPWLFNIYIHGFQYFTLRYGYVQ